MSQAVRSLYFVAPRLVEVRPAELAPPAMGQVRVQTLLSAISPGTEMLIYRGEAPANLAADETLAALGGTLAFPLKYGYSAVGRVVELGQGVSASWIDQLVFGFNPHESAFVADVASLMRVPAGVDAEDAVFLPNVETAVNFLLDGGPRIGEDVVVVGQGVVGLLTTALLARTPLASLVTLDRFVQRRDWSRALGAGQSLDPADTAAILARQAGADLVFELSGSPAGLDLAIGLAGFAARVVIGSWYGAKRADLDLGGRFHRSRMRLISSQVSSLTPELMARWTKARRMDVAWRMLAELKPSRLITHRIAFDQAAQAYAAIDQDPAHTLQAVLSY